MSATIRSSYVPVNGHVYSLEENSDASDANGKPLSKFSHLSNFTGTDEGAFRTLQAVGYASELAGCEPLAAVCAAGREALTFPRLFGATKEAIDAIKGITETRDVPRKFRRVAIRSERPPADQIRYRISNAIARGTEAISTYCTAGSILAERVFSSSLAASNLAKMGDACSLVSDTADAEMAAKDWNRARLTVQALRGQDAPQQVVERFVYTQRSALLKMAKSVLSVVIGIFSAWAMLFGTALISTAAAAALGLAVALVGSASTLYKQAMPNKPVEMLHYIPIRV